MWPLSLRVILKQQRFTGVRCAYTVVPHGLKGWTKDRQEQDINALWNRRQCTKFNGASYIVQKGAAAVYSEQGRQQIAEGIDYYMGNAQVIREELKKAGSFGIWGD